MFVGANGQIWMSSGMDGMLMRLDDDGRIMSWLGERGRPDRAFDLGVGSNSTLRLPTTGLPTDPNVARRGRCDRHLAALGEGRVVGATLH